MSLVVCFYQANHHRALMNFVEAQAQYYAQCHAYMTELQKQLARYNLAHFIFQYFNSGEEGLQLLPMELAGALWFGRYCKLLVAWYTLTTTSWRDKFQRTCWKWSPCVCWSWKSVGCLVCWSGQLSEIILLSPPGHLLGEILVKTLEPYDTVPIVRYEELF